MSKEARSRAGSVARWTRASDSPPQCALLRGNHDHANALEQFNAERLAHIFQVGDDRPLIGLDSRALLRRLGSALRERAEVFPGVGRPGQLYELLSHAAVRGGDGAARKSPSGASLRCTFCAPC